ncbi:MAG: hypothetical protein ACLQQ4_05455 [Bacteroidia bacterium]
MHPIEIQIKQALENSEEWIKFYATESEKKLIKRLRINRLQYAIAEKDNDERTGELLNIMERIIIEARIYKDENNIPDTPSEIELALAESEMMLEKEGERNETLRPMKQVQARQAQGDKTEEQKEILNVSIHSVIDSGPKAEPQNDADSQLSLF